MRLNLDYLIEKLWEHLNLIKVFTKKRGRKYNQNILCLYPVLQSQHSNVRLTYRFISEKPDLVDGIIMRNGATVEAVVSYDDDDK